MALTDSDMPKLIELLNQIDIRFKVRRKTAAEWTASNEVLLSGEWGKETDTDLMKQGDGVTAWNALGYFAASSNFNVQTVVSSVTVTPDAANDLVVISAQGAALTVANPSGTETDGLGFLLRIKDNGTARPLSFGSKYRAVGGVLPSITTVGEWLYLPVSYNATDDKWDLFVDDPEGGQYQSVLSAASVTPNAKDDLITVYAQAAGLTINNPVGVALPTSGFLIQLKDDGAARALTWGSDYVPIGASLPTTTTANKWVYIPVVYNAPDSKWHLILPGTIQQ